MFSFKFACFPLHQRVPVLNQFLPLPLPPFRDRIPVTNASASSQSRKHKMQLLSFLSLSQFLSFPNPPRQFLNNTSQIPTSPFPNHSLFSLTRHTPVLPASKTRDLSTTMLATMPCTPFPGRTAFGFESVVTHDFPGSTGEDFYR